MKFFRAKVRVWPLIVFSILVVGAAIVASVTGVLNPLTLGSIFTTSTSTHSSEVIKEVLPQEEVALARLRIQGLEHADSDGALMGIRVPAADRTKYLEYSFDAKLGIDGSKVDVVRAGEHKYSVMIPAFIFIGHSNEHFEDPIEENGVLSWLTEEISQSEMTNRILSAEKKDEYVANSLQILKDQSEAFYGGIIRSVDPEAVLTFEFEQ